MITRTFKGAPGAPKAAIEPVSRLVSTLNAAGYGCALFERDFQPGKFVVKGDTENGFAVSWKPLGGLGPVGA